VSAPRPLLAVALAISGCTSPQLALELESHASYVIAQLGAHDAVIELHAYDKVSTSIARFDVDANEARFRVLSYDVSLRTLRIEVDGDARVALSTDGWPLPPPAAVSDHGDGGEQQPTREAVAAWLGTFEVAEPPCAPEPRVRTIEGLPEGSQVHVALPVGEDVVVGLTELPGTRSVFRISDGRSTRIHTRPVSGPYQRHPLGFMDDGTPWFVMPGTGTITATYDLINGLDGTTVATAIEPALGIHELWGVASARIDGQRVVVGRATSRVIVPERTDDPFLYDTMVRLDEATGRWRALEPRSSQVSVCEPARVFQALEIDAHGIVTTPRADGPLSTFDVAVQPIAWTTVLPEVPQVCRSSVTRAKRIEIMTVVGPRMILGSGSIAWRFDGGAWSFQADAQVDGHGLGVVPGGFASAGPRYGVLIYELSAARQDIPPRLCYTKYLAMQPQQIVMLPSGRVFVGGLSEPQSNGTGGPTAIYFDF